MPFLFNDWGLGCTRTKCVCPAKYIAGSPACLLFNVGFLFGNGLFYPFVLYRPRRRRVTFDITHPEASEREKRARAGGRKLN